MKKIFAVAILIAVIFSCLIACEKDGTEKNYEKTSYSSASYADYKKELDFATEIIKKDWRENRNGDYIIENNLCSEYDITGARIVYVKDDTQIEDFVNVDYIVEFFGYVNYYTNSYKHELSRATTNNVIVNKDGTGSSDYRTILKYDKIKYSYENEFIDNVVYVNYDEIYRITLIDEYKVPFNVYSDYNTQLDSAKELLINDWVASAREEGNVKNNACNEYILTGARIIYFKEDNELQQLSSYDAIKSNIGENIDYVIEFYGFVNFFGDYGNELYDIPLNNANVKIEVYVKEDGSMFSDYNRMHSYSSITYDMSYNYVKNVVNVKFDQIEKITINTSK